MTGYTERYLAAAVRSLPPAAQSEVRAELAASITDAIEARVHQGQRRESAERAVLTDLGDPDVLAAGYADRPLHLVGPRFYVAWSRLLRLLMIIVLPCVAGAVALGQALAGAGAGQIIGTMFVLTLSTAVHLAFWTTLVFVILERTGQDAIGPWDIDGLPEPHADRGALRGDTVARLVFLALAVAALFWDRFVGLARVDGDALPVLNPELWPWWVTGLLVLMAAEAARVTAVYRKGHHTVGHAAVSTALNVVLAVPAIALVREGLLLNPALIDLLTAEGANDDLGRVMAVVIGFSIAAVALVDVGQAWRRAWVALGATRPQAAPAGV